MASWMEQKFEFHALRQWEKNAEATIADLYESLGKPAAPAPRKRYSTKKA
jgi:hypothetical protein